MQAACECGLTSSTMPLYSGILIKNLQIRKNKRTQQKHIVTQRKHKENTKLHCFLTRLSAFLDFVMVENGPAGRFSSRNGVIFEQGDFWVVENENEKSTDLGMTVLFKIAESKRMTGNQ